MLASDLVRDLQAIAKVHGDLEVVVGIERSGYGESVIDISSSRTWDLVGEDGKRVRVLEIVLGDERLCYGRLV